MKPKSILFSVVVAVGIAVAQPAAPKSPLPPKFIGYLAIGTDKWFALALMASDEKTERQSWLKIGQKFDGFEIVTFDVKKEALTLKRSDGGVIEIRMATSKVLDGGDSEAQLQRILKQLANPSIRDLPYQTR